MKSAKAITLKLLKISREIDISYQRLLISFFHERLLFRISQSEYKNNLLLKGGSLLYFFQGNEARPTSDIDFAGKHINNEVQNFKFIFEEIIKIEGFDFIEFEKDSINVTVINEQKKYSGLRINISAKIENIKHKYQIDIGFGDVVTPSEKFIEYPTIIEGFKTPIILAYTIETVIAEKLHAILILGVLNSRMKDYFDIYTIAKTQKIDYITLKEAIFLTFTNRKTEIDYNSIVFEPQYFNDKQTQTMWKAFLRKINVEPILFEDVIVAIKDLTKKVI